MKNAPYLHILAAIFALNLCAAQVTVSSNPRIYQKVTLSIPTPDSFSETPATFRDYRMSVTIQSPNQSFQVPAYFAGDGNAANTSATSGNIWRAHFIPLEGGTYSYTISFRQGPNIAASQNAQAGSTLAPDGATGSFTVGSQPLQEGFLAHGKLEYRGMSMARFSDGTYFLEFGPDSPETFLEYGEFDGTPSNRSYPVHIPDWDTGDPTWQGDKGKGIIGVVNYVAEQGMNVHYFVTMSVEGDGKNTFPFTGPTNILTYDVSKLDQWQIVLDYMMRKGVAAEIVLLETENLNFFEAQSGVPVTAFSDARKIYYRELMARFGYLNAVFFNIGEEANWDSGGDQYTAEQIEEAAIYLQQLSPYNDLISVHNGPSNNDRIFGELLDLPGNTPLTAISVQGNFSSIESGHNWMLRWIQRSREAGTPWVVRYTEPFSSSANPDIEVWTDNSLWAALMAGAPGVHYYHGGGQDISNQDYTRNQGFFERMRHARNFFEDNEVPFQTLVNRDALIEKGYLLTDNQDIYVTFLPDGGSTNIDLPAGTYQLGWYNPRSGGSLQGVRELSTNGSLTTGNPPSQTNQSWALLLRRTGGGGGQGCTADYEEQNGLVVIEAEGIDQQAWTVRNDVAGFSGDGFIVWGQGSFFNTPGNGLIQVSIQINQTGEYAFKWRSKVGAGTSPTDENDSWLRFPDADAFFARKGNNVIYPKGSGLTPNPNGAGADGWFKVYSSGTTDWTWSTNTSDNDAHQIFVRFDEPGVYTMEISGRSNAHFIDRIVLSQNVANPQDLALAETPCTGGGIIPVEGVSIQPSSLNLEIGATGQLNLNFTPSNASNKNVTWTSDDSSVASVDTAGLVSAVGVGSTLVRVRTEDGDFTDTVQVVVTEEGMGNTLTGLTITPGQLTLTPGDTFALAVRAEPQGQEIPALLWSSTDPSVATVDNQGLVTALFPGSVTIRVSTTDGLISDTITLTVGDFELVLAPNPVGPEKRVELGGLPEGSYILTLVGIDGKKYYSETVFLQEGYTVDLTRYPTGSYVVLMENLTGSYSAILIMP